MKIILIFCSLLITSCNINYNKKKFYNSNYTRKKI